MSYRGIYWYFITNQSNPLCDLEINLMTLQVFFLQPQTYHKKNVSSRYLLIFHYQSINGSISNHWLPLKTLPLQKSNECILRIHCHSFGTNAIGFDCQLVGYFWKPTPFNWLRLMSLHSHENHYIVPSFTIVNDYQGVEHFPLSILYS